MPKIRLNHVFWVGFAVLGLWWIVDDIWDNYTHRNIEPREITARGDLASDERATIAIFNQV